MLVSTGYPFYLLLVASFLIIFLLEKILDSLITLITTDQSYAIVRIIHRFKLYIIQNNENWVDKNWRNTKKKKR